ncbi:MAG TPA: tail fiber protein [Candidatus Limnocylindrales bacterium]|nr:tail fiber protein [Candidatus Limnocylindrales bacterium]
MAEPFLAEVRIFSFNFPPKGWAFCNGQVLPISQNQALFSILGTTYGGDGRTNFALPNLQGRVPVHTGNGINLGQPGGEAAHTLSISEMPAHNHPVVGSSSVGSAGPGGSLWATDNTGANPYGAGSVNTVMNPASVGQSGGSQAHENMSPYLVLNFCIALQGIFPSRS